MWLGHANLKGGMRPAGSGLVRAAGVTFVALLVANCSQQKLGRLIDSKYGVAASPKVIADGEPVPKGGGRDFLGRPYTVAGRTYVPQANQRYAGEGLASWYGVNFHGRLTANGEIFDRDAIAAAHTTMPLPSYARVTNLQNGRSIIVRVNDRGPFHANRVIDVSERTAEALEFRRIGTARVRVEYVSRASIAGSDDRILLASLRTDGSPAAIPATSRTMVAEANIRQPLPRSTMALSPPIQEVEAEDEISEPALSVSIRGQGTAGVPLPPERPFDLGTIPHAATPIAMIGSPQRAVLPPARPVVAGLYFKAQEIPPSRFGERSAFGSLRQQDIAPVKSRL